MKNVLTSTKKGFLMVTMFATLLSFANEVSFFTIKYDAKKTTITLENVKKGNLLSIKDDSGNILYKEHMQKPGFYTKGFDLTSLPNGSYIFELDGDLEIKTIPFTVNLNIVSFLKELELTTFKPIVRLKDNILFISKLNLSLNPVEIEVYFNGDKASSFNSGIIYNETINDTQKIERVLKLAILDIGTYKIIIKYGGREFIKDIIK